MKPYTENNIQDICVVYDSRSNKRKTSGNHYISVRRWRTQCPNSFRFLRAILLITINNISELAIPHEFRDYWFQLSWFNWSSLDIVLWSGKYYVWNNIARFELLFWSYIEFILIKSTPLHFSPITMYSLECIAFFWLYINLYGY